ncbi:MAG: hypothetical protein ABI295_11945 [Xanthomarina sp.]
MSIKKDIILLSLFFFLFLEISAQVGIGTTNPDASSILDVESSNSGVLIPRITLTSTLIAAPVVSPATSLLIYNTNTINDVSPGFYFWNVDHWSRMSDSSNNSLSKVYGEIYDNQSRQNLPRTSRQQMNPGQPINFNVAQEIQGVIPIPPAPLTHHGFEIVTSGIYRVSYALSIDMWVSPETTTLPSPVTLGFYLTTSTAVPPITPVTGNITGSFSHTRVTLLGNSSCSMSKIIHLNAGDIIRLYPDSLLAIVYVIPNTATMNIELIKAD